MHIDEPKVDVLAKTKIHAKIRTKTKEDIFASGSRITHDVVSEELPLHNQSMASQITTQWYVLH